MNDQDKIEALEQLTRVQAELVSYQARVMTQLMIERDEAKRNLKQASEQWKQWRKETNEL